MADRPSARDEDRLPWLDSFEGEKKRTRGRKPVSRTALVGLLVAFFGVGLAVAFSLGYRFARSPAEAPAPTQAEQPQRTATVQVPLAPPVPLPKAELVAPQAVAEPPAELPKAAVAAKAKPVAKKAKVTKKRYSKRKPILRPFKLTRQPALVPTPPPLPASPPAIRSQPPPPPGPKGRMIQLGAYSTQRQAEAAWRTIVFRYPYLKAKPRVVVPTKPIGGWTYHRLRLGTESQAQSVVICQYLQSRGQSCIVIY